MAKHTQTIRRQFADKLFECVWPFCGIGAFHSKICQENILQHVFYVIIANKTLFRFHVNTVL